MYRIVNNLLESATYVPSNHHGALAVQGIVGIVWHWTGGIGKTEQYAKNLANGIAASNPNADKDRVSWHLLISRGGAVYQSVPFDRAAWHVGKPGIINNIEFKNVNSCTIGIELENAGDDPLLPKERLASDGKHDDFPVAQRTAAQAVLRLIQQQFKLSNANCSFGHSMFDPVRKRDQGSLWLNTYLPTLLT